MSEEIELVNNTIPSNVFPRYEGDLIGSIKKQTWHVQSKKSDSSSAGDVLDDPTNVKYWKAVCPFLQVRNNTHPNHNLEINEKVVKAMKQRIIDEGYTQMPSHAFRWVELAKTVRKGICKLVENGIPPSFIVVFDECWMILNIIGKLMYKVSGNKSNMDILAWNIDCREGEPESGFSPHRDRQPADVPSSFRSDHTAKYTTSWIPLTDASSENSALFVIPKQYDPGYLNGDGDKDPLMESLNSKEKFQNIRCLSTESFGAILFTHRIMHWGSKGRSGYHTPRIALSYAFSTDDFEPSYILPEYDGSNNTLLYNPPFEVRLALGCGQMLCYHERYSFKPSQLRAFYEYFMENSSKFHFTYVQKVKGEFVASVKDSFSRDIPIKATDDDSNDDSDEEVLDLALDNILDDPMNQEDDFHDSDLEQLDEDEENGYGDKDEEEEEEEEEVELFPVVKKQKK